MSEHLFLGDTAYPHTQATFPAELIDQHKIEKQFEVWAKSVHLKHCNVEGAWQGYQAALAQQASGWISVDEHLPLEHAGVLISFVDQYQYPQVVDGFYFKLSNGELVWNQNTEFCDAQGGWEGAIINHQKLKVTHWMPIPTAPEGGENHEAKKVA